MIGHKTEGSIRSSQSSSIPSNDSDFTHVDMMTDAEVEECFERMLVSFFFIYIIHMLMFIKTRRGIHDANARLKMSSFSVDKKRIMVAQDIQSESNATQPTSRRGGTDKKIEEGKGPDYYVKKLSDTSKGVNANIVSHLAVGLRTMPLR